MTISTNGMLSMVAQCAYLASYKDPLVVRQGVMLRSTSSSQPVDCSTQQLSTVPRPSVTASSPLLVTDSVNLTDDTISQTNASCGVSSTSGQIAQNQMVHNFSCTDPCSYWVLYILDSSMPLGGRCSSLPVYPGHHEYPERCHRRVQQSQFGVQKLDDNLDQWNVEHGGTVRLPSFIQRPSRR
ncbi:hypothetical protein EMCRGX_G012185 [Ephydatia muelleri]